MVYIQARNVKARTFLSSLTLFLFLLLLLFFSFFFSSFCVFVKRLQLPRWSAWKFSYYYYFPPDTQSHQQWPRPQFRWRPMTRNVQCVINCSLTPSCSPAVISCVVTVWSAGHSPRPRRTVLFAAVSSWIQKSEAVGYESLHVCFCQVNFLVVAISVGVIFRAFKGGIIWSWYWRHPFPTYRRLWGSQEEVTADVEVSRVLAGCASDDGASPLVSG